MKFGATLRESSSDLPEVEGLFLMYKGLKKELKKLPNREEVQQQTAAGSQAQHEALSAEESNFVCQMEEKLSTVNTMFLDKEEEAVIRLDCLQQEAREGLDSARRLDLQRRLVEYHGEVLLLVHWSVLAYTATVKILKKHHKRTGLLLKAPHLEDLLSHPFCSTEVMTQLATRAEQTICEMGGSLAWQEATSGVKGEHEAGLAVQRPRPPSDSGSNKPRGRGKGTKQTAGENLQPCALPCEHKDLQHMQGRQQALHSAAHPARRQQEGLASADAPSYQQALHSASHPADASDCQQLLHSAAQPASLQQAGQVQEQAGQAEWPPPPPSGPRHRYQTPPPTSSDPCQSDPTQPTSLGPCHSNPAAPTFSGFCHSDQPATDHHTKIPAMQPPSFRPRSGCPPASLLPTHACFGALAADPHPVLPAQPPSQLAPQGLQQQQQQQEQQQLSLPHLQHHQPQQQPQQQPSQHQQVILQQLQATQQVFQLFQAQQLQQRLQHEPGLRVFTPKQQQHHHHQLPPQQQQIPKQQGLPQQQQQQQQQPQRSPPDGSSGDLHKSDSSHDADAPMFARPHAIPPNFDVLRRTQVALNTWSQLCATASTPSTVLNVYGNNSLMACQEHKDSTVMGGIGVGDDVSGQGAGGGSRMHGGSEDSLHHAGATAAAGKALGWGWQRGGDRGSREGGVRGRRNWGSSKEEDGGSTLSGRGEKSSGEVHEKGGGSGGLLQQLQWQHSLTCSQALPFLAEPLQPLQQQHSLTHSQILPFLEAQPLQLQQQQQQQQQQPQQRVSCHDGRQQQEQQQPDRGRAHPQAKGKRTRHQASQGGGHFPGPIAGSGNSSGSRSKRVRQASGGCSNSANNASGSGNANSGCGSAHV